MNANEIQQQHQAPKKYCMITLMFPIEHDDDAIRVKQAIDKAIADKPDKRFTFQIVDN